jgi:RNA polymerase sigma-70 factor, ECF subfamily
MASTPLHPSTTLARSTDRAVPAVRPHLLDPTELPDYTDQLFRVAYALCRSRQDAEDLVQDTFERVLRRPRLLLRDGDLGYLHTVLHNTWIDSYKARERRPKTVELDETIEFMIDERADPSISIADKHAVYTAVSTLSPAARATIVAVDIAGLSYKEAASVLGVRKGTIMSRLSRARDHVGEQLKRAGIGPPAGTEAGRATSTASV